MGDLATMTVVPEGRGTTDDARGVVSESTRYIIMYSVATNVIYKQSLQLL